MSNVVMHLSRIGAVATWRYGIFNILQLNERHGDDHMSVDKDNRALAFGKLIIGLMTGLGSLKTARYTLQKQTII